MPRANRSLIEPGAAMLALNICRGVVAAALAALAVFPPGRLAAAPDLCVFRRVMGIECLGCGMTRAICSALHGEITTALAHNALVVIVLPALAAFVFLPAPRVVAAIARCRMLRREPAIKEIAGQAAVT